MAKFERSWLGQKIRRIKNTSHLINAWLANIYYGFPSHGLKVLGVTGTDGKTTTCFYLYRILSAAGKKVALVTTIEARFGDQVVDVGLHVTNPNSWQLQRLIQRIKSEGMEYLVLEVTSHGIDQKRIWGVDFDVAGLTNVTHEHLDYHGSIDEYRRVKMSFLQMAKKSFLAEDIADDLINGISVNLPGAYNQKNAKLAAQMALAVGASMEAVKLGIEGLTELNGRMQTVYRGEFQVVVDFAHTPNGLKEALTSARKLIGEDGEGRLIVVFGSAGERDFTKRDLMGEIAGKLANLVVITAEDPRHEDVNQIAAQISRGVERAGKKLDIDYYIETDRQKAIDLVINKLARKADVVILTGKGHEKSMNFAGIEYPWSDQNAVQHAFSVRTLA